MHRATRGSPPPRQLDDGGYDLALHALAQLPDRFKLELGIDSSMTGRAEELARAYGVEDRLQPSPTLAGALPTTAVFASPSEATSVRFRTDDHSLATVARNGESEVVHSMAELVGALHAPDGDVASCRVRDDVLAGQRVAIVVNRPTHYRVPVLNRVSRRLAAVGGRLFVLFTDDLGTKPWMRPEPLEFEHRSLTSLASVSRVPAAPLDLGRQLRRIDPTLLVAGGLSPLVAGRMAYYGHRHGVTFGVWNGEIDTRETARSSLRRRQREWVMSRAAFGISYGSRSGEYLRRLAPGLQLVYARNTTPVPTIPARPVHRKGVLEVLTVGRALALKRLDVLVAAFKLLTDVPCRLTIVGDGPALPALREQAGPLTNVRFLGTLRSDRVAEAYAEADAFVFPSYDDVFGLVLVEAMGAGLPTIASSRPGAVADLISPGQNGLVLDGYEPATWAAAIRSLGEDAARRESLGRMARDTILGRWTLDHSADAIIAGLRLGVFASGRRRPAAVT